MGVTRDDRAGSAVPDLDAALIERLAELAHDSWAGWTSWMFEKWEQTHASGETFQQRWVRQMSTRYADLSEQEKESDRAEARKMLDVVGARCRALREEVARLKDQNSRLIAQIEEDRWDDWGATPCEVCGAGCLYGSRHTQCADVARRAVQGDEARAENARLRAAMEDAVAELRDSSVRRDLQAALAGPAPAPEEAP